MKKNYFSSNWLIQMSFFVAISLISSNSSMAYHGTTENLFSLPYVSSQENPLEIKVSINVKNVTLSQFINELQKKVGNRAYLNLSLDDINDTKADITVNYSSAPIGQILDDVLLKRKLTYTRKGNVLAIIKVADKEIPSVKILVVDEENATPMSGATILVTGVNQGAISDKTGVGILKNIKEGSAVEISMVGYKTQTIYIKSGVATITVKMKTEMVDISEVVVTGYQVIDKRLSTSSVVSIMAEDVLEPVGMTIDNMLQGKIAGMSVMNQSSTVGAAPKIRIRGSSSILGNREPVWVVDGIILDDPVPLDPTMLNSLDQVNLVGNAISSLNPEDIERIDILKDASATAIYGVKAANGVIVITTKRGKKGPASIRYSTAMNVIERPKSSQMYLMNSKERIEVSEEMHNRGLEYYGFSPKGLGYEGALQELWDGQIASDQFYSKVQKLKNTNTDWYKELFRNSFSHAHTISVSGATDVVNYYFSLGYSSQTGTPIHESGDRLNFMANVDVKVSKRINMRLGLNSSTSEDKRPHYSVDLNEYAYNTSRAINLYNEDGSLLFYDQQEAYPGTPNLIYNIKNELNNTGQKQNQQGYNANLNANFNIAKGLDLNAILAYSTMSTRDESYITEQSYYASELRETVYGYKFPNPNVNTSSDYKNYAENRNSLPVGGILESDDYRNATYNGRVSLSFNRTFAEMHSVSVTGGAEIRSSTYNGVEEEVWGYLPERGKQIAKIDYGTWTNFRKEQLDRKPKFLDTKSNTMSYYGTAAYAYDSRYIVSANIRGDASNKLGMDKTARFLPIWSFSGRWNIDREKFFESVTWISALAVRASYGIQGNVTDAHNPNLLISLGTIDNLSDEYISTVATLPNKGLLWEKTNSFNVGLDFSFLNGAIRGTFEYYNKQGRDQLISTEVAPANGSKSVTLNAGDITNRGWELSLSTTPIDTKNFTWNLNFNTSQNKNKITNQGNVAYGRTDYIAGSIMRNGMAVNSFYSYQFDKLDNTGFPTFLGTAERDKDGNLITEKERAFAQVFKYSGKREADFTGGINTSFRYKFISFNALFSLSLGAKMRLNKLFPNDNFRLPYPQTNMQVEFVDRWRKPGDELITNIPALTDRVASVVPDGAMRYAYDNYWSMYDNSDLRVVSANFLRCRTMSLSVVIPSSLTRSFYCRNASLSFGVSNPFVIKSKALNGRDPEATELGYGALPPLRTYSMSLSLSF